MPWLVPLARRPERVAPAAIASALCGLVALIAVLVPGAAFAATSTEPFADKQWGLRQIGAERAWDVSRGLGARVGIIDTGIDLGHGELAGRVVDSTRCIGTRGLASDCGGSAQDDRGHGTHVAGIVAAPVDGTGVAGVAPEASLLIVKALDADGSGESLDVVAGIDWLLSRDVHVLNLSLAQTGLVRGAQGSPIKAAVERASSLGVVVVLAAGNDEKATQHRVGSDLPAIVVGATGRNGLVAPYSQPLDGLVRWGLVAPGGDGSSEVEGDVISTYWFAGRRSTYAWSAGTSMATAHVSGVGALLAARGVRGQAAVDQMLATAAAAPCGSACRGVVDASSALGLGPASGPAAAAAAPPVPVPLPVPVTAPAAVPIAREAEVPVTAPKPTVSGPAGHRVSRGGQVALRVEQRPAAVPQPEGGRSDRLAWSAVASGSGLLGMSAAVAVLGRRRVRRGARW